MDTLVFDCELDEVLGLEDYMDLTEPEHDLAYKFEPVSSTSCLDNQWTDNRQVVDLFGFRNKAGSSSEDSSLNTRSTTATLSRSSSEQSLLSRSSSGLSDNSGTSLAFHDVSHQQGAAVRTRFGDMKLVQGASPQSSRLSRDLGSFNHRPKDIHGQTMQSLSNENSQEFLGGYNSSDSADFELVGDVYATPLTSAQDGSQELHMSMMEEMLLGDIVGGVGNHNGSHWSASPDLHEANIVSMPGPSTLFDSQQCFSPPDLSQANMMTPSCHDFGSMRNLDVHNSMNTSLKEDKHGLFPKPWESLPDSKGSSQGEHERHGELDAKGEYNSTFNQHPWDEEMISFEKVSRGCLQMAGLAPETGLQPGGKRDEDFEGIRLVHLLLASAEAIACRHVDLASVILDRLKDLVSRTGSTMQRVAAYFSEGLQNLVDGSRGASESKFPSEAQLEVLGAFQVLHEVSPYIKFGHFTANQAILEACEGERRVHIIDYDIMEGIQWPSLMQALACREGGPPHLHITALCRGPAGAKRALVSIQETGKRLSEFAASLDIPFSFHPARIDTTESQFRPSLLRLVKGEALIVNCMVHLPHMPHQSMTSVSTFLKSMQILQPRLLTLVEEELSCQTPTFVSQFFEALHHYSALFDSLEACLSSESRGRILVERIFLAPRIASIVAAGNSPHNQNWLTGEGHENQGKQNWCSLAQGAGFCPVQLSIYNTSQAKHLLALFGDGYNLDKDGGRLLLGWRAKPLIAASAWSCN